MKRPEKIKLVACVNDNVYNQACDVWEKFLPSEKEINQLYCKNCPHKICKQECDMNRWIVVKAISKRIGK